MADNRSLSSLHQPIVERETYTFDVAAGPGGIPPAEEQRLSGWFHALNLRPGDRLGVDDPFDDPAIRQSVAALAGRRGVLVGEAAPATAGELPPGMARIVLQRSRARVPGCPDWSAKSDVNLANATTSNYGCANNANLAAMVADPEHLLHGADDPGSTVVMTGNKAITSYREAPPTGERGLRPSSTLDAASSGGN